MKLLLVFNPNARFGRAPRILKPILQLFTDLGVDVQVLETTHSGSATQQLAQSELSSFDGIVAAGGDGTLFDVLNGLYHQEPNSRPPLGVIPVGTGNAFSRDLGIEAGDWKKAVRIIAAARVKPIDVGRVTMPSDSFYFLNILGMGFAVEAGLTALKLKRLGNSAYTLGTLWRTLFLKSHQLEIEIDGELIEQDNILLEISNTRYTGTHFLIAPGAKMDDGLLDVTLLSKLPRLRLLRFFPSIYSGRHVEYKEVTVVQAKSIRIKTPVGFMLAPDGEFHGSTPAEIDCLHHDLMFFRS
jgi:diacylglycerol kinase (ATP)